MVKEDKTRVFHLYVKETGEQRYFASLGALFNAYAREDIGIAYQSLKNYWQKTDEPYENALCVIIKGKLERNQK